MILISIQISCSLYKLKNHSLKFWNHIDSDHTLATCYPNSYYSSLLCDSVYCIWLVFRAPSMFSVSFIE